MIDQSIAYFWCNYIAKTKPYKNRSFRTQLNSGISYPVSDSLLNSNSRGIESLKLNNISVKRQKRNIPGDGRCSESHSRAESGGMNNFNLGETVADQLHFVYKSMVMFLPD